MTDDEIKCAKSWLDELAELREKVGYRVNENARLLKCIDDKDELYNGLLKTANDERDSARSKLYKVCKLLNTLHFAVIRLKSGREKKKTDFIVEILNLEKEAQIVAEDIRFFRDDNGKESAK